MNLYQNLLVGSIWMWKDIIFFTLLLDCHVYYWIVYYFGLKKKNSKTEKGGVLWVFLFT